MDSPQVKRAKRESLFLQEIAQLFLFAAQDNAELQDLHPQRVSFSSDGGLCTIYFYSPRGKELFEEKLSVLKLFKPSLRASIAKRIPSRRVPDFIFKYDEAAEKQKKIDDLLLKLKEEGKL